MLSDRDALLAAIGAEPGEDTPRLAYADYLDEAPRAELVRVQCELAAAEAEYGGSYAMYAFLRDRYHHGLLTTDWTRIDRGVHRLVALERRADALLTQHRAGWQPGLPKRARAWWADASDDEARLGGFARGFPHRLAMNGKAEVGRLRDRLRGVPPVTLVSDGLSPEWVAELADAGLAGWVAGLDLRGECDDGLRALGHRPEAARVRALRLRYTYVPAAAAALADAPHWTGLHALDLSDTMVRRGDLLPMAASGKLAGLRRLHVRGDGEWTADDVRALLGGGFTQLNSLRLTSCGLDDEAAAALAGSPALANLRDLDLAHNRITGRGLTDLLCSPHLRRLAYLGVDGNPLTGVDADRLAAAEPAGLRLLNCHGGRLRAVDVRALVRCPRVRTVWYLDFDDNNLGPHGVRELIRGGGAWCPPLLWLIRNRLDDRAAHLLGGWKAAAGLVALHVKYNPGISDAGLLELLDSPNLTRLGALGASPHDDRTVAALRARFPHADGY